MIDNEIVDCGDYIKLTFIDVCSVTIIKKNVENNIVDFLKTVKLNCISLAKKCNVDFKNLYCNNLINGMTVMWTLIRLERLYGE